MSRYNTIKPTTPDVITQTFSALPENDRELFSALFDGVMQNISGQLKIHVDRETFNNVWTASMFPERLSQAVLRLVEQYLDRQALTTSTPESIVNNTPETHSMNC